MGTKGVRQINNSAGFLRWAGSKRQLLPTLSHFWEDRHQRYIEPFAGSACFFFKLKPQQAILGDINRELISTYVEVKYRVRSVVEELSKLKKGKEAYLRIRNIEDVDQLSASARAARFIYLNRFCFNGLYRTNLNGRFNVPYGGEKSGDLPSEKHLRNCSSILRNALLVPGDFEKVLSLAKRGDFVYLDPPYSVEAKRVFKEYNAAVFSNADLARLRYWLERFRERKVDFLVSYARCEEAEILREGFEYREVSVRRNIAGFSQSRLESKEILISSGHIPQFIVP